MAHEQLSAPRSQIDQDLQDLEDFPAEERFLFLRETIFHPMQTGDLRISGLKKHHPPHQYGALHVEFDASQLPVDASQPAEYVLPDVPSPLTHDLESESGRSVDSLRDLPRFVHDQYGTNEYYFAEVKQCYMVRIPKERNPKLYLHMSECTAIIGRNESDVFVAHVGFGLKSQNDAAVEFMQKNGVKPEDMFIVANTLGDDPDFDPDGVGPAFPVEKRILTKGGFAKYGLPTENFVSYSDNWLTVDDPEIMADVAPDYQYEGKVHPIMEVIVDKDGLYAGRAVNSRKLQVSEKLLEDPIYKPA